MNLQLINSFDRRAYLLQFVLTILCVSHSIFGQSNIPHSFQVSTSFEGGSAKFLSIDQQTNTIRLRPGGDPEEGWPAWWFFRVDSLQPGTTLNITIADPPIGFWAKPDRATWSVDGQEWKHTAPGIIEGESITYSQQIDGNQAWFAWGPPFLYQDAKAIVSHMDRTHDYASSFTLAESPGGREVPALRIMEGKKSVLERPVVWIQARQHAWESGSSWVGKGFIEWLTGAEPAARQLREEAEIIYVPVMDVDNVATGNGGKNELPYDHNRDWSDNPIYPVVTEAQKRLLAYDREQRLSLFVDLHNPGNKKTAYFMVPPDEMMDEKTRSNFKAFTEDCKRNITDPIPFDPEPAIMSASYSDRWQAISNYWVVQHTSPGVVGLTLETAWNSPASTTEGYMQVGQQLGQSIVGYLKDH